MNEPTKTKTDHATIKRSVREHYGRAARRVTQGKGGSCCDPDQGSSCDDSISRELYDADEGSSVPSDALAASLGCGNPTALAELCEGETVLDLGSGGGIDVLLSARRVGPTGKAYGLDMTREMLELARANQAEAKVDNVEFLEGEIENIPLPDGSVDVVISNCVINLSADKDKVLAEALRVLRPGGRLAVTDIVVRGPIPTSIRRSVELWAGCVAGALEEEEYRSKLTAAGFEEIDVEPVRIYRAADVGANSQSCCIPDEDLEQVDGKFMSAFVRARKPMAIMPM